jgi:hypothetical protein
MLPIMLLHSSTPPPNEMNLFSKLNVSMYCSTPGWHYNISLIGGRGLPVIHAPNLSAYKWHTAYQMRKQTNFEEKNLPKLNQLPFSCLIFLAFPVNFEMVTNNFSPPA